MFPASLDEHGGVARTAREVHHSQGGHASVPGHSHATGMACQPEIKDAVQLLVPAL